MFYLNKDEESLYSLDNSKFTHLSQGCFQTFSASPILEDLNVSGMIKNRKLSRAISFQGWRQFRVFCEAKSVKYGRELVVISRWEPTSQICSECGYKWGKLDLKVRSVQCVNCGATHDRDKFFSKNINKVGMGNRHDSKCTSRRSKTISVVSVGEA